MLKGKRFIAAAFAALGLAIFLGALGLRYWKGRGADSPSVPVFSLFDGVALHQKNGLVELYGADLRQHQAGPIRLSRSVLQLSAERAYVFWTPDASPAHGASTVVLRVAEKLPDARLAFGVLTHKGNSFVFEISPGLFARKRPRGERPGTMPEAYFNAAASPTAVTPLRAAGDGVYVAAFPPALAEELADPAAGGKAVRALFLAVEGRAGERLSFAAAGLNAPAPAPPSPATVSLAGEVRDASLPPGSVIRLVSEKGEVIEQALSLDNRFRFTGVPAGMPVSIRFPHKLRDYYAGAGRWLAAESDRSDLDISLAPDYVNPDGHPADPTQAKFVGPGKPSQVAAFYEPHARQVWPGISKPQEFDGLTFTNNMGFVDRDRYFDNPDACLRFVHLGSSNSVALQVRPFEKYNIVLESELGVRLQRCVEVVSVGRDNGDIGSNYERIRDYALKFQPAALLLENSTSLMIQMHPGLLRRAFGWDHEFNALGNFYYAAGGELRYRPASSEYGLHAVKPDATPIPPGIPLHLVQQVPFERMPEMGKESFKYLADILRYLQKQHPGPRYVVHTALDEVVQCRDKCEQSLALKDGGRVRAGAAVFLENHRRFCTEQQLACIFPQGTELYRTPDTYLTFQQDAHYSVRGHQWLARELERGLLELGLAGK